MNILISIILCLLRKKYCYIYIIQNLEKLDISNKDNWNLIIKVYSNNIDESILYNIIDCYKSIILYN